MSVFDGNSDMAHEGTKISYARKRYFFNTSVSTVYF